MNEKVKAVYEYLPERYRNSIEQEAMYADIGNIERITLTVMLATAATVILGGLLLPYSLMVRTTIILIMVSVAPPIIPYVMISIAAEKRKKEMENVLPDALLLISANLKSGLSIEKAFLLSARDEFGPLADELRQTAMEMFGGKPVQQSLNEMEKRIKSELFSETLKLLVDGLESGGNTANLLESSADDIRKSLELREEINSNIRMYVIFILMAAVVGAPLLFSISVYMSSSTAHMWDNVNLQQMSRAQSGSQGFTMSFQKPSVNTAFFEQFSVMAIIAINFFAGLIISEIKNANVKEGAKYIPVLIVVSITLFFIIKTTIGGLVGGFV
ncbi:MAG: type II secretion system F family protein [Candidatus Nanohaloarchaea archaeon]